MDIGTGDVVDFAGANGLNVFHTAGVKTVNIGISSGGIANDRLANSTISGVSLGSNLASLSAGTGISMTAYNGSTARTISLESVGPGAGTYGSTSNSTKIDQITLDAQGRVTAITTGGPET